VQKQKQGKTFLYEDSKADTHSSMQVRICKSFQFQNVSEHNSFIHY